MNIQLATTPRISSANFPRKFSVANGEHESAELRGGDTVTLSAASQKPPGAGKLKRSAWKAAWLACTAAVGMFALVGCVPPPVAPTAPKNQPVAEHVETSVPSTFQKQAPAAEREAPKTELEVKIRELELRERELALREKELAKGNAVDASQKRVNDLRARQIQRQEAEKKAENIANTIEGGAKLLDLLGKEVSKTLR